MSYIQSRGYYGRTCIGAYHLEDGKIVKDFEFDSDNYLGEDGWSLYSGQGYHSLSIADVDYDGKDEIIFGNLVLDNDGEPMYSTHLGHGDALHVGDLGSEVNDGNGVYKWDPQGNEINPIFKAVGAHSVNSAKSNPSLQADIFGDWREELIFPSDDMEHLRIYTSTTPTSYRIPTLMSDGQYRDAIGWQNVCYNQPPHVGYYLGYGTKTIPVPQISVKKADGTVLKNPDLDKKAWSISDLYAGDSVDLVLDNATAFINGAKQLVDEENAEVKPYLDETDRTMVPIRFISEAFGAKVDYAADTKAITIKDGAKTVTMTVGSEEYTVDDKKDTMDTVPVIVNDRTMVPVRFIAQALGKNVDYYDGLIHISTVGGGLSEAAAAAQKAAITSTSTPAKRADVVLDNYAEEAAGLRIKIADATWLEKPDYGVEESAAETPKDAKAVIDYDLSTSVTIPAHGVITIDNGGWAGVPAAVIAFGDDKVHHFRIDYSGNGTSWQIALADRVSDGVSGKYEKFYFGCPLYPRYVRYVSLDDYDTTISEFAQARVE